MTDGRSNVNHATVRQSAVAAGARVMTYALGDGVNADSQESLKKLACVSSFQLQKPIILNTKYITFDTKSSFLKIISLETNRCESGGVFTLVGDNDDLGLAMASYYKVFAAGMAPCVFDIQKIKICQQNTKILEQKMKTLPLKDYDFWCRADQCKVTWSNYEGAMSDIEFISACVFRHFV